MIIESKGRRYGSCLVSFSYKGDTVNFSSNNTKDLFKGVIDWLYNNGYKFQGPLHTGTSTKILSEREVDEVVSKTTYEKRMFYNILGSGNYIAFNSKVKQLFGFLTNMLVSFGVDEKSIVYEGLDQDQFKIKKIGEVDADEEDFDLDQYSKLFENIKTASTEVFKCINDTNFLNQKLNEVDKEFFREYLEFRRVGPVNDLRAEVAERLIENELTTEELVEIINRHRSEKPQQFKSWSNPYKILHPFINQKFKKFDGEMQNFANQISEEFDGLRFKINNFNGAQQQGSDKYWIAFYNKTLANQSVSLQLFINFVNGVSEYGIYRYNGDEYLVGPETYTGMEKFSEFLYENIDTILDDEDESGQIQPPQEDDSVIKPFSPYSSSTIDQVPSYTTTADRAISKPTDKFDWTLSSDLPNKMTSDTKTGHIQSLFIDAICILGTSGKGKSYTTELILDSIDNLEYEFIIPSASTTNLLAQFSPSSKSGGYVTSRLGKLIMKAYNNPSKDYVAVFDECHKANVIEMINDELLQCISTKRNKGRRFISLEQEIADLYTGLSDFRGNLLLPSNFGFVFLSSKPDVIVKNADFFNRVNTYIMIERPEEGEIKSSYGKDLEGKIELKQPFFVLQSDPNQILNQFDESKNK